MRIVLPEPLARQEGRLAALQARVESDPGFAAEVDALLAEREKSAAAEQAQSRLEARARVYKRTRPARYTQATVDGLHEQQNPSGKVTRWFESGAQQLVLAGPSGHGKSHAAWAVTNQAAAAGLYVVGWNVPDLVDSLGRPGAHDRFDEVRSAERERVEQRLMDADVVLLDDLGAEDAAGWWRGLVYRIVDHRLTEGLRTVVTFNAATHEEAGETIARRYDDRVLSRLYENAWWGWVQGVSLRKAYPVPPFEGGAQ